MILDIVSDENYAGLLQKIAWEFSVLFEFVININQGHYVSLSTIKKWNRDENRKWMLVDLIQRDCQDDNLLKTIKESR
jgi:phosphoribosyl-AMP cyclohydrolase